MMQSKIRQLRIDSGLDTIEATEKLKISYSFLNKIERGDRQPGRDLIERMSKLYECSIDQIYKSLGRSECRIC
ncbi:helix-turn-helix transcriptional regulator [Clostridium tyrobutyricum]|nr:helix-turn-helix transcriptional regulator [Clostridium tyrobutyricum]